VPLALQSSFIAPLNSVLLLQAKSQGNLFLSIQIASSLVASLKLLAFIALI
jgi:hypothetical protein